MKSLYVPALLDGLANVNHRCLLKDNKFGLFQGKYDPSWYTDKAMFFHEHVLTSYYISKKWPNFRKTQRIRDDVTLWADSGGYSIATQGVKIDPIEALKWQEENSNIAFSLDYPPIKVTGTTQIAPGKGERIPLDEFEKRAEISRKNNLVYLNNRTRSDLLIYNVIHGWDLKTKDMWWDYVTRDTKFEGYCIGTKPVNDPLLQAMNLMYLYNKGVRERVHMLGISGITVIPLIIWASQYIDKLSFDSKSYGYGAITRAYVYPERIRYYTHFGNKYKLKKKKMEKIYCNCPICKNFEDPSFFLGGGSTWPGCLLSLHNLWCVKEYVKELDITLNRDKDKEKFFKMIREHTGNWADKTIHGINFIEDFMKFGFEKTYETYFANHRITKDRFKERKLF
jgi:hypothetical protein